MIIIYGGSFGHLGPAKQVWALGPNYPRKWSLSVPLGSQGLGAGRVSALADSPDGATMDVTELPEDARP